MNLSADEKLLIERMSARTPVLVLGAGFSIGAKNGTGKPLMTGRELSQALFDNVLAKGRKVRKEDLAAYRQEAQDLKKTCDNIELEGLRERRDAFLKIQFGTCFCPKDDFHMLLREYPWRYIFTLNIDDLVEYIYSDCPKEQQPLVHVKQSSTLRSSASLELYKLHGSVSRPDLGYVFDSEEYRAYAASASWTLTTFGHQAMTNDVIFLGTEFQEEDMHLMLQQLAAMVEVVQPPHYFFVTPEIHDRAAEPEDPGQQKYALHPLEDRALPQDGQGGDRRHQRDPPGRCGTTAWSFTMSSTRRRTGRSRSI